MSKINKLNFGLWLIIAQLSATGSAALAQITPDTTLLNNSAVTRTGEQITIDEGTVNGSSLFHSFSKFNLRTGETAFFNNGMTIDNIITRVTGGELSTIDGLIKANDTANLFLLNPSGIQFGPNAALNIGGSFVGSTADSLLFEDGSLFSAAKPEVAPLLTVSVPIGLQFGASPGAIVNRSQATQVNDYGTEHVLGLQVQPARTLALVGGDVRLEGGQLSSAAGTINLSQVGASLVGSDGLELNPQTAGGRIEVGAVGANSQVQIAQSPDNPQILNFSYEGVEHFQDIQLSDLAVVDASGDGGGAIQLQGKNVTISEGSLIRSNTLGENPGETLAIHATESLQVLGNTLLDDSIDPRLAGAGIFIPRRTSISTNTYSNGSAGEITIEADKVIVDRGAQIAAYIFHEGRGGDISIRATDSLEIIGQTIPLDFAPEIFFPFGFDFPGFGEAAFRSFISSSSVSTSSFISGNPGNIVIDTGRLTIRDGAVVLTNPIFRGDGGTITVNATESVEVSGTSKFNIPPNNFGISRSLLWTATTDSGDAHSLTINTQKLIIRDGGTIQATAFATVEPGDVFINASESVEISGAGFSPTDGNLPSNLSASSFGTSNAGSLIINTDQLTVADGAEVAVNSTEIGDGGDLSINANSLFLDRGLITATSTSGEGGRIALIADDQILLRRNSNISTTAGLEGSGGDGGNITINSPFLIAPPFEDSDITANAFDGNGGNIEISTNGIFGIKFRETETDQSDITASSEFGLAGTVAINNPDVDPTSALVELPSQVNDPSDKVIAGCAADSGNSFTINGQGGLPENPNNNTIYGQTILSDLRDFTTASGSKEDLPPVNKQGRQQPPQSLVQVKGWIVNQDGEVELVAALPQETPFLKYPNCQDLGR